MEEIKLFAHSGMFGASPRDTMLDSLLRLLARQIEDKNEWPDKYGANFENDVFSMHKYCWCEKESCEWCGKKHYPNFEFKPTGFKVWWYKYIGRDVETSQEPTVTQLNEIYAACVNSIKARAQGQHTTNGYMVQDFQSFTQIATNKIIDLLQLHIA